MKLLQVARPCLLTRGRTTTKPLHPIIIGPLFWTISSLNLTESGFWLCFCQQMSKKMWKSEIHSMNSAGAIKHHNFFDVTTTSPPFWTFGWGTNQYLFTKGQCNNQRSLLQPMPFFHFITLWGDAILHLAFMHSYQCGSAKNVIKRWVINLMLVARRQKKTALICSLPLCTQEWESASVCAGLLSAELPAHD